MIYPGIYELKDSTVFAEIETEIQTDIDSLGDLSQYDNSKDMPEGFDLENEFSMETLNTIDTTQPTPEVKYKLTDYGDELCLKYYEFFYGIKGLGCPRGYTSSRFFTEGGFIGLKNDKENSSHWVLSICWTESENGFDYIYDQVDKNTISYSTTNKGFNYRLYHLPKLEYGKFYNGRKASANSFEWQILLGGDISPRIYRDWLGLQV